MRELDDTGAVAVYLHVPEKTVRQWRYLGTGPRAVKLGRHVRYRKSDVDSWIESRADEPRPTA